MDVVPTVSLSKCSKSCAVKVDPVVMHQVGVLTGIFTRSAKPDLTFILINTVHIADNVFAPGDPVPDLARGNVNQVEVAPAVPLRNVDDFF